MTHVELRGKSGTAGDPVREKTRRKSVLFCPVCGFEAPVDDGWVATEADRHSALACPDCGTVVAAR